MNSGKSRFKKPDFGTGLGYAYIHFATEVMCFYYLFYVMKASEYWLIFTIVYDVLAFAPQAAVGAFCEKHPRFRPDITGGLLLLAGAGIGYAARATVPALTVAGLVLVCAGNVFIHIAGAFATLAVSEGRLSESAIFVGGGSFGLITGKLFASYGESFAVPGLIMVSALVAMFLTDRRNPHESFSVRPCRQDIVKESFMPRGGIVILLMAAVVAVRAYIGYGIPTVWNDTVIKGIILYCVMGIGKALGGVLADIFGARRVGVLSCILSIPPLLAGSRIMWISLIGVLLFSMTMAITLGALVSVMKENPGLAFGVTTLGLLTGTLPVIFLPMPGGTCMYILIGVMSVLSSGAFALVLKKEKGIFPSARVQGDENQSLP